VRTSTTRAAFAAAALLVLGAAGAAPAQVVTEYPIPTPGSGPLRITLGPDGNLWFVEGQVNKIGRITPAGVVTEFPTTASMPDGPNGICAGPDGNLWFTLSHGKIGRMTTAGAATLFTAPPPALGFAGCTAGPDGAIWFADDAFSRIGRITTAGVFTLIPIPGVTAQPNSIVSGPDGALWFTDTARSRIGRVTTGGSFTFYPTPTLNASPIDLAFDADGNLWFTEKSISAPQIGRMTPAGVTTEYLTPGLSPPNFIAKGPDGNMWVTGPNQTNGHVGRVLANGTMLQFPILTVDGGSAGIVAGPDGALWFAEEAKGKIGRVTTAATFHPLSPCRVADTRLPDGIYGGPALVNSWERPYVLAGPCGIPSGATAVSFNFTVTAPTTAGYIRIYPTQSFAPDIQSLSFSAGQTRANNAILGLGPDRDITVHVDLPDFETVHFIIDVNGYFQ
jgi:streptogramin lyase